MSNFAILLIVWNFIVLFVYGFDKIRAKNGGRRIREYTLISCAFLLGGTGAMFGMVLFNHKTSKTKFRILVPLATVAKAIIIYYLCKSGGWLL